MAPPVDGSGGEIWYDVIATHYRREVWQSFQDIIRGAPDEVKASGGSFFQWANGNYATTQLVAVRRQADPRNDVISLRRALTELIRADILTDQASQHRDSLDREARGVMAHVGDHIAHLGDPAKRVSWQPPDGLTFGMLHNVIDHLGEVFQWYYEKLMEAHLDLGRIISQPWEHAFRFAWLPELENPWAARPPSA